VSPQLLPLTPILSVQLDLRRCDFDRLADVDLELGRRVRDGLIAENLAGFLPDPTRATSTAARTCSAIAIAARAATAQRRAQIRTAWTTSSEAAP
jgi:hypothetical protein